MTTAVDTNVVVAYWGPDPSLNLAIESSLKSSFELGNVMVSAPVFAELAAGPGRTESFVTGFLEDSGIAIDWQFDEAVWRSAARAFQGYAARRRSHRDFGTRRILTDFLIGAHAAVHDYRLLTLDTRLYRAAFPNLKIATV